jgi:PAS domain S-box-containing protein
MTTSPPPDPLESAHREGGSSPLPAVDRATSDGREARERAAAIARGEARGSEPDYELCAPELPGLKADLLFTLVAENVRDYAIFLMDADGIIRCWGEGARLMKWWTRQQAEGSHLSFLYKDGGSEDGTAEAHLAQAADKGEYSGEGHRVRSDGSLFWAYVTLTALRNEAGTLVGFSKVTRDFTARRAAEAALRRQPDTAQDVKALLETANRQQRLLATISHELRAPLNALLGYVALLERGIGGPERQASHLDAVKRSGQHLLDVTGDLLDLSRSEAGALRVSPAGNRLGPAVDDALADVHGAAMAAGVTVTNAVSGGPSDLPYWGDAPRVRQILVNLVTNAIKFTGRNGQVTVSAGTGENVTGVSLAGHGPWIYLRVEDNGRGIPAERLEAIFEPYQQTDSADRQRGTGLGLAISRQLARAMGGDLTARSEPGVGSTFTLWLPIAASGPIPR